MTIHFLLIDKLDCNDHLYVYDGAHAVGTHKVSNYFVKFLYAMVYHETVGCTANNYTEIRFVICTLLKKKLCK